MMPYFAAYTAYAKDIVNNMFNRAIAATVPAAVYLGLSPGDPLRAGTPTELVAATAPGYARVAAAPADWSASSGGTMTNAAALTFPTNAGTEPWPAAQSLFAADAATGGNVLWSCRLPADSGGLGQAVAAGAALSVPAGALTIPAE